MLGGPQSVLQSAEQQQQQQQEQQQQQGQEPPPPQQQGEGVQHLHLHPPPHGKQQQAQQAQDGVQQEAAASSNAMFAAEAAETAAVLCAPDVAECAEFGREVELIVQQKAEQMLLTHLQQCGMLEQFEAQVLNGQLPAEQLPDALSGSRHQGLGPRVAAVLQELIDQEAWAFMSTPGFRALVAAEVKAAAAQVMARELQAADMSFHAVGADGMVRRSEAVHQAVFQLLASAMDEARETQQGWMWDTMVAAIKLPKSFAV